MEVLALFPSVRGLLDFMLSVIDLSTGAGVIGDISEPRERGGYFAMFNLGPMVRKQSP